MSIRRSSIVLGVAGVAVIVLAIVVRFVVVPIATRLPGDTDVTAHYVGVASLLNSEAWRPATSPTPSHRTYR